MNSTPNRLINEKSPYLLQHAYNPVDWFPWGNEAFKKAEQENKPILLSIGYSTCHWCHVMAHEAFNDMETAKYLNDNYVSIKVDREERPDIDETYMLACQFLTNSCGWPLNAIITPDKKPFFAGSYFPIKEMLNRPVFIDILKEIKNAWDADRPRVDEVKTKIIKEINKLQETKKGTNLDRNTLLSTYNQLKEDFDPEYGGFGTAPKFPIPHHLEFLLHWYKTTAETDALEMAETTLNSMYRGGIFDHVGGGFHRYATDRHWLIPHFEKMLYDQALIAIAYLKAYEITGNKLYADVARKTLDYTLKDLRDKNGGFYCGSDADTEGEEGKFYTWTHDEISQILGDNSDLFSEYFGITKKGNFEQGKNVLYITKSIDKIAQEHYLNADKLNEFINNSLEKLSDARNKRVHPFIDDKIITSWNGLLIKALALAGRVLNDNKYTIAAIQASEFILTNLINPEGKLLRRYRDNEADILGFLDDYTFLIYGLLELYNATADDIYLKLSSNLADTMINDFYDDEQGGFFTISYDAEIPLINLKESYDNAVPSGNSIAALIFLQLADFCNNQDYKYKTEEIFEIFSTKVNKVPIAHTQLLTALMP